MEYKKLIEVAKIKFCTITPSRSKPSIEPTNWLVCANFLADNVINLDFTTNNATPDDDWLLHKDDIVIKRITPAFVNYIDQIPPGTYCGNNLIIVTPKNQVDAKYLAMILNEQICNLSRDSSIGAVMKSVSRSDLEELTIPMPDIKTQKTIGGIWYNGIELKKKKVRLAELENIRTNFKLTKAIGMIGGQENG